MARWNSGVHLHAGLTTPVVGHLKVWAHLPDPDRLEVVFSLPLDEIGLEDGGHLKGVTAFSGLGSYLTGATKVLDTVKLK